MLAGSNGGGERAHPVPRPAPKASPVRQAAQRRVEYAPPRTQEYKGQPLQSERGERQVRERVAARKEHAFGPKPSESTKPTRTGGPLRVPSWSPVTHSEGKDWIGDQIVRPGVQYNGGTAAPKPHILKGTDPNEPERHKGNRKPGGGRETYVTPAGAVRA